MRVIYFDDDAESLSDIREGFYWALGQRHLQGRVPFDGRNNDWYAVASEAIERNRAGEKSVWLIDLRVDSPNKIRDAAELTEHVQKRLDGDKAFAAAAHQLEDLRLEEWPGIGLAILASDNGIPFRVVSQNRGSVDHQLFGFLVHRNMDSLKQEKWSFDKRLLKVPDPGARPDVVEEYLRIVDWVCSVDPNLQPAELARRKRRRNWILIWTIITALLTAALFVLAVWRPEHRENTPTPMLTPTPSPTPTPSIQFRDFSFLVTPNRESATFTDLIRSPRTPITTASQFRVTAKPTSGAHLCLFALNCDGTVTILQTDESESFSYPANGSVNASVAREAGFQGYLLVATSGGLDVLHRIEQDLGGIWRKSTMSGVWHYDTDSVLSQLDTPPTPPDGASVLVCNRLTKLHDAQQIKAAHFIAFKVKGKK